jgi:acyl-CoA thioesterase-1
VLADHISYESQKVIKNQNSTGANIIAFGDSLTEGIGATKGNDYVSILSKEIGQPILNKGRQGDTTAQALARIDDVLKNDPKIVIVYLGGNDVLQGVAPETTFKNLSTIIEKIQAKGAAVILVGVRGGIFKDPYKDRFKELTGIYQTAFVPDMMISILGNEELLYTDSVHPNDKGYEIIAEKIGESLHKLLP